MVLEKVIQQFEEQAELRHAELMAILEEIKAILNKDKPPK